MSSAIRRSPAHIDFVVGRKLEPDERVVSYYDPISNDFIAERVDTGRIQKDADRVKALLAVIPERKTGKQGRPRHLNRQSLQLRTPIHVVEFLKEMAKEAGVSASDLVSLLILKAYALSVQSAQLQRIAEGFDVPKDFMETDAILIRREFIKQSGLIKDDRMLDLLEKEREADEALEPTTRQSKKKR